MVAVPYDWTPEQRQALTEAVSSTGIKVKDLVDEPIAIATAHGLHRFKGKKWALICDFGHAALQVSLLDISDDTLSVENHVRDDSCG